MGTLARQLARSSPDLEKSICEAFASDEDVIRRGMRNQWKELIVTPLSTTGSCSHNPLNIVIDALDECDSEDDIRLILRLFTEIKDFKNVDLGIFITSRPEVVLRLGFNSMPEIIHQKLSLEGIPRHVMEHDISVLLNREFESMRLQHQLQDWPSEDDRLSLLQRSDCLFIYAKTACRYIGDLDWDPKERLAEILYGTSTKGGATSQLDEMYMHVLKQALTAGRSTADAAQLCDRFKHLVGSIVVLLDELPILALAQLLSMTPTSVDTGLRRLHSVLNIPPDEASPIRMLHPSFHDFVLEESRCTDQRFCVDGKDAHGKLARHCLRVMSSMLRRNICRLRTPGSPPQDVDQGVIDRYVPKHLQYTCPYWVDHLARSRPHDHTSSGLDTEVRSFFQKDFLHWLEVSLFPAHDSRPLSIYTISIYTDLELPSVEALAMQSYWLPTDVLMLHPGVAVPFRDIAMALAQQYGGDLLTPVVALGDESDGEDVSSGADDNPIGESNNGLPPPNLKRCSFGH